jgi:hypothetical protein
MGWIKLVNCPRELFQKAELLSKPYNKNQLIGIAKRFCESQPHDVQEKIRPERIELRGRNLMICWFAHHLDAFNLSADDHSEQGWEEHLEWEFTLNHDDDTTFQEFSNE